MKKTLLYAVLLTSLMGNAQCWKSVSAGSLSALGIKMDDTLWSWGYAGWGGLGNGDTTTDVATPQQVGTATNWKNVYTGTNQYFAIKYDLTLWAWGSNNNGQLGINSTTAIISEPTQVGTQLWKMVASGSDHSIGIRNNGTLWGWGDNSEGAIGDGTLMNKPFPVLINNSTNWKMVSCSIDTNIALKNDGTIWAWGNNNASLGLGGANYSAPNVKVPTQVGTDTDWKYVAAGFGRILALKTDNTLWAWGSGYIGTESGYTTFSHFPMQISSETDWDTIQISIQSAFGLKLDGTFRVWGNNNGGQLGNGTTNSIGVPTEVIYNYDWKAIISKGSYTLALLTDGSMYSWGNNYYGTLGNGDLGTDQYQPQLVNTCSLSTDKFNKNKINSYPNPVQNSLFIDADETQSYELYSILGSKISEGTLSVGNSIDCSNLTSGVYLLNLTNDLGNVSTVKFVKQ